MSPEQLWAVGWQLPAPGEFRRADSCQPCPAKLLRGHQQCLSSSGNCHGELSSLQLQQQHSSSLQLGHWDGDLQDPARAAQPRTFWNREWRQSIAGASQFPRIRTGSSQGSPLRAPASVLHHHTPCWTGIIPFPWPREDQQRAVGWIPPGRAELRAARGYWNCSTGQTLSSPKRLKKYLSTK